MTIQLISFDLDDTLWFLDDVIHKAEQRMYSVFENNLKDQGIQRDPLTSSEWQIIAHQQAEHLTAIAHDMSAMRIEILRYLYTSSGVSAKLALALAEDTFHQMWLERIQVTPFNNVIDVLNRLGQRYKIAALSNGNACLKHVALDHLFDWHFQPADTGAKKPDAQMFQHLLNSAGVKAQETIHVGDNPREDVQGALEFGIYPVWANYRQNDWPLESQISQPLTIHSFGEIESAIEQINQASNR